MEKQTLPLHDCQPNCEACDARQFSIFSTIASSQLCTISEAKQYRQYRKGEEIYSEGSAALGLYCLNSGEIKISRLGEEGRETLLRVIFSGGVFGYRSLLAGDLHSNRAIAMEESVVCFIPHNLLKHLIHTSPFIHNGLINCLSVDIRQAEDRIVSTAQKPVLSRIAEVLLVLTANGVEPEEITMTREELAGMVGTVPETTIRGLAKLRRMGLISLSRKHVTILDRRQLIDIAKIDH